MVLVGDEAQLEARFGPFGYSANPDSRSVHYSCQTYHRIRNCFRHTRWNSQVMHPMVLLGDEAQLESHFGPFGDSTNIDARSVRGLRPMYHRLGNRFGRTRWNSQVTWVMWNLVRSVWRWCQCQCKIGARFTAYIIQDTPDGTCNTLGVKHALNLDIA